ncbi:Fe(3+) ions import ATP-binding protein FbpC 2 [Flavobacterium sp. CECT 9288]|nr:Fe(3+) ions import ATP-binding protein FbpC 2 [Flavobacterium sp. CECT 9288]
MMLEIKNIHFSYSDKPVITDINFTIEKGQNIAIIGESGCGKSTLLKLIYGLLDLNSGSISYNEKPILGPKYNLIPGVDYIKYLAQDFDLMPYTTVEENVGKFLSSAFLPLKKLRIQELLEMVEMTEFAKVKAKDLSGGQQQRVALAKALALEPEILLLDEPFSHIDNFRKNALRRNLFAYLKKKGITCIIATHDSVDSLSFADETIVLQQGQVVIKGASRALYELPANKYVASLFGEVNEFMLSQIIDIDPADDEYLLLYPHQLKVVDNAKMTAVVKQCYFRGGHFLVKAAFDRRAIFFEHDTELNFNQEVNLMLA